MWKQFLVPLVALGSLTFAVTHVISSQTPAPAKAPVVEPAHSPFSKTVAGAGIVEARSDASNTANIAVGSILSGVVVRAPIRVGQVVKAGEPLFELDDRQLQAELALREANLAATRSQLLRLEQMPRPEELPPLEAKVSEAEANLADLMDQEQRAARIVKSQAISEEDYFHRKQAVGMGRQQLAKAQADLALAKAGAWQADLAVSRAAVAQAEAQVQQAKVDLDRLIVRAPIAGTVLQLNLRVGEYVGTPPNQALVVLGDLGQLHVRVDIDENDIHRFRADAPAQATLRGDPKTRFDLKFVRVEPFVVPKKSLTGDNVERVDTRVLQAIYAVVNSSVPLFVGQQVDVFVEVK
jgi:multidrug resistance efflux pump